MAYMTLEQLRRYARPRVPVGVGGIVKEAKKFRPGTDLFLSHSHLDRPALDQVEDFFSTFGATAYRDVDDDLLPTSPSGTTAHTLRDRIANCRRFVVATSANVRTSRWIPWELGYADAKKGLENIALLPIAPDAAVTAVVEQEYLAIYPVIERIRLQGQDKERWCVKDPRDGTWWTIEQWLA